MSDSPKTGKPAVDDLGSWDFEGTRRHHLEQGLRMTPAERLRWLEETMDEMRRLQGLARFGRKIDTSED
jgi:hypothetical protein